MCFILFFENLPKINELHSFTTDPMVDTWFLMESPGPMLCIVGIYLIFVLKAGPKMMEKRPAFQLNTLMILYNAFQVLFSMWLISLVSLIIYSIFLPSVFNIKQTRKCIINTSFHIFSYSIFKRMLYELMLFKDTIKRLL